MHTRQACKRQLYKRCCSSNADDGLLLRTGFEVFPELLRGLKDQLVTQISDRRSAVSRQVCHTLGVTVAALGPRFEWLAQILVPALCKVMGTA